MGKLKGVQVAMVGKRQLLPILKILIAIYAFTAAYLHGPVRDALYPSNKPLS